MAVPSKAGVPKLSQLQASLRKSAAPKPGAAPTQSLKRPAEDPAEGAQAKKLAATSPSGQIAAKPSAVKASITKQPSGVVPGKPSGPGLQAKGPPPSPATQVSLGVGTAVKSSGTPDRPIMTKAKSSDALGAVPVKRPPPVAVSNGQPSAQDPEAPIVVDENAAQALAAFTASLKGQQGKPKLVLLTRLMDSISQDLTIEQSLYIMRLYRKKMLERATSEGVQVNVARQPAVAPAASVKQAAVAPAAAVKSAPAVVKSAPTNTVPSAAVKSAPAVVKSAPANTMSSPPAVKATASTTTAPRPVAQPPSARPTATAMPTGPVPPDSPPPSDDPSELFALIGSLTEDPVYEEGLLKETRLNQVLQRLWNGVAKKPKDWLAAWQAMLIPLENQAEALQKFLNMAFVQSQGLSQERAPVIIAELVKSFKIKFSIAEEVLIAFGHNIDGILAINEEAWHAYAYFFLHIYPKEKLAGWGWSRVGWVVLGWWKFVEKAISSLEASKAFDVLCMVLRLVQEKEGVPLNQVRSWDPPRLKQVVAKLAELGACSESEATSRLAMDGVSVTLEVPAEGE